MTHIAQADHTLARQVSERVGRFVSAQRMAELREDGLIVFQERGGKRGKPGREPGRYPKGTDEQATEALDLIRSKLGRDTTAAILYVRGWSVSLAARKRFARASLLKLQTVVTLALSATADEWRKSFGTSQSEPDRAYRSIFGSNAAEVSEWLSGVVSGDAAAIAAPHQDVASALGIESWGRGHVDYDDRKFKEGFAPAEAIERVGRWSDLGQAMVAPLLTDVDARLDDEGSWEGARSLAQAFLDQERARRAAGEMLPRFAAHAQRPIERIFTDARRTRSVEARTGLLLVFSLLKPIDDDALEEAFAVHEARRAWLEAHAVLGRDCPQRLRRTVDEVLVHEMETTQGVVRWYEDWSERKPGLQAAINGWSCHESHRGEPRS